MINPNPSESFQGDHPISMKNHLPTDMQEKKQELCASQGNPPDHIGVDAVPSKDTFKRGNQKQQRMKKDLSSIFVVVGYVFGREARGPYFPWS
jgi:hypothetical protein